MNDTKGLVEISFTKNKPISTHFACLVSLI